MKRRVFCLILASLLLCACGSTPVEEAQEPSDASRRVASPSGREEIPPTEAPSAEPESEPVPEPTPEPTPAPDPVETAFYQEGDYADSVGNSYHYLYRIPVFTAGSDDALRLSNHMYDAVMSLIRSDLDAIGGSDKYSLVCYKADYQVYVTGDYVSVVEQAENDWGCDEFIVMNLNAATGRELSRAELLAIAGLDETSFLPLAREAAGAAFGDTSRFSGDLLQFAEDQYAKTVMDENFGPDLPLFLNGEGRLCMVARIYSLAGADYYYHVIEI